MKLKSILSVAKKLAPLVILYGPKAVKLIKEATKKPR